MAKVQDIPTTDDVEETGIIVRLKEGLLIVTAETEEEQSALAAWSAAVDRHAFVLKAQDARTFRLNSLGPRAEACREPINITSQSTDPELRLISESNKKSGVSRCHQRLPDRILRRSEIRIPFPEGILPVVVENLRAHLT